MIFKVQCSCCTRPAPPTGNFLAGKPWQVCNVSSQHTASCSSHPPPTLLCCNVARGFQTATTIMIEASRAEAKAAGAGWKTLVLAILAVLCGFLTFNFHYIITTSHVHISLAHHHKTTAFCAFIGCKLNPEGKSWSQPSSYMSAATTPLRLALPWAASLAPVNASWCARTQTLAT